MYQSKHKQTTHKTENHLEKEPELHPAHQQQIEEVKCIQCKTQEMEVYDFFPFDRLSKLKEIYQNDELYCEKLTLVELLSKQGVQAICAENQSQNYFIDKKLNFDMNDQNLRFETLLNNQPLKVEDE